MPLLQILSEEQRLDKLSADLQTAVDDAELNLQHVFSSHLILAGAGHVENSVIQILSEYGRVNGNLIIKRFVEKTISRKNSLNCEKIKAVSDQFDTEWWRRLEGEVGFPEMEAVDSLKTLRDQVAHGKRNGTGFTVVKGYFDRAKVFVRKYSFIVLGY